MSTKKRSPRRRSDPEHDLERLVERAREFSRPYRVDDGKRFRLADHDPGDTGGLGHEDKPRAKEALATGIEALARYQERLYAQDRWSLLLVFQAMDAAGKDSAIKHVLSGVNPQGCQVTSFKAPSSGRSRPRKPYANRLAPQTPDVTRLEREEVGLGTVRVTACRGVRVGRMEESGLVLVGEGGAIVEPNVDVVRSGQGDSRAERRSQPIGEGAGERQGQLLLHRPGRAQGAGLRAAVPGIERRTALRRRGNARRRGRDRFERHDGAVDEG